MSTPTSTTPTKKKVCYILDRLSAETRIDIYKHILGPCEYASFGSPQASESGEAADTSTLLHTSIFAANRQLHDEALETFSNEKVVRLTFAQLEDLLKSDSFRAFARDIEIIECDKADEAQAVQSVLSKAQQLQRIRSITILSDYLAYTGEPDKHVTVRQWTSGMGLGKITCTDIGHYQLQGAYSSVRFRHSKLLVMWPNVRSTPDDYDGVAESTAIQRSWSFGDFVTNLMAWTSQSSLRLWVGLYESWKAWASGPNPVNLDDPEAMHRSTCLSSWFRTTTHRRPDVPFALLGKDRSVSMHNLGPQHDPITLESATELLSMNIATYTKSGYPDDGPDRELLRPRWSELGEKSEGEEKAVWYPEVMQAFREQRMITHPTDQDCRWHLDTAQDMILGNEAWTHAFGGEDAIRSADKLGLQEMLYLIIAAEGMATTDEEGNEQLDAWSKALLVKYLLLCLPDTEASTWDDADLETLREVFERALDIMLRSARHQAEAGDTGHAGDAGDADGLDETEAQEEEEHGNVVDDVNAQAENVQHEAGDDTAIGQEVTTTEDPDIYQPFIAKAGPALIAAMQLQLLETASHDGGEADRGGRETEGRRRASV